MNKIYYKIFGELEVPYKTLHIESDLDVRNTNNLVAIIRRCAEDFLLNHDGWREYWPIYMAVLDGEDGNIICRSIAELEFILTLFVMETDYKKAMSDE